MVAPNILITEALDSEIQTPLAGTARVFLRSSTGTLALRKSDGTVQDLGPANKPVAILNSNHTLTNADAGYLFVVQAGVTLTLPDTLAANLDFEFLMDQGAILTYSVTGSSSLQTETGFITLTGVGKRGNLFHLGGGTYIATGQYQSSDIFGSIPGLQFLFDPNDSGSLTLNGSNVSQMDDLSGNGYHATQGTGTAQPLRIVGGLNGRDTLRFDGGDWMEFGVAANLINFTKVQHTVVGIVVNFGTGNERWLTQQDGNSGEYELGWKGGPERIEFEYDDNGHLSSALDYNVWHVYGYRKSTSNTRFTDLDGTLGFSSASGSSKHDSTGGFTLGGESSRINGEVALLAGYNRNLTTSELNTLYTHMLGLAGI